MKPSLHPREKERLETLSQLAILDTDPEREFDEIVQLASSVCGVKIAYVSLVDRDREWFKAKTGFEDQNIREAPRDSSFCAHAILRTGPTIIDDAAQDPRFSDNPQVTGYPHIRFYAGFPLITANGLPVGALCVIDPVSRKLDQRQLGMLKSLANQITSRLEIRMLHNKLMKLAVMHSMTEERFVQRERKRIYDVVDRQQKFLSDILNSVKDPIFVKNREHRWIFMNEAFVSLMGIPGERLIGKTDHDFFSKEMADGFWKYDEQVFSSGEVNETEESIRTAEGNTRVILTKKSLCLDSQGGTVLVGVIRDITDRKAAETALEEQRLKLLATSKMSALGEMSAGLAHEINNPLAIIHGKAEQLMDAAGSNRLDAKKVADNAQKIAVTAMRISKIVKGLRTFARDAGSDPFWPVPVIEVIGDTLELCQQRFASSGVKLKILPFDDQLEIECRTSQISQVMLNLLNNALDAASEQKEGGWVKVVCSDEGKDIEIRVIDSGLGIPPETRDKIMQPFFTTKEIGKGTGLGLSVSKGLVDSHGGSLRLDEGSRHTCFVIRLPKKQKKRKSAA